MRKAIVSLLAAGAALALPAAASANNDSSLEDVYDAGRCMVERDRHAAVGLLGTLPIDATQADLSDLPAGLAERCGRRLGSVTGLHLRGAIAQALFLRDFGSFGVEPRRSTPLVNLSLPVQDSPSGDRAIELYRWGDCLVRNDGIHVERLLASSIGSRTETQLIASMRDYMAACAPAGAQLAVHPGELRSVLAQSAYQSMYRYWTGRLEPVNDR